MAVIKLKKKVEYKWWGSLGWCAASVRCCPLLRFPGTIYNILKWWTHVRHPNGNASLFFPLVPLVHKCVQCRCIYCIRNIILYESLYPFEAVMSILWQHCGPVLINYVLSFRILRLRENGILDKLVRKHFGMLKNQLCTPDHHVTQSTLSVVDVWPVFVVLGAGLALSVIALLIEHIWPMLIDVYTLFLSLKKNWHPQCSLTYLPLDKMTAIWQTIY